MAPVDEEGHTGSTAGAGGEPRVPVEEVSRKNRQTILERQSMGIAGRLTRDIDTLKAKMRAYEKEFPSDCTPQNDRQLQDAKDLVDLLAIVTDGYKSIVKLQNDIITCVCTSIYLQDIDIENEIAKAQDLLETYQNTFNKFKQDKVFSKTRDRADVYIKACKNRPTNSQVISNSAPNVNKVPVFKPQPELKPQILGKECQLLEFSTWAKNFCSYIKSSPFELPEGAIDDNIRVMHGSNMVCGAGRKRIR